VTLKQRQSPELIPHDAIAFAGRVLQFCPVGDGDVAAGVVNEPRVMQLPRRQCDRSARRPDHEAEKLVRQRHSVLLDPVMTSQQPTREPLRDLVVSIAEGIVSRLNHKTLDVFVQILLHRARTVKRFL